MKQPSVDLKQLPAQAAIIGKKVLQYHLIITFVAAASLLIFAVISVNSILESSTDQDYHDAEQSKAIKTKFDTDTIGKINELRSREENPTLELPSGRISPFRE